MTELLLTHGYFLYEDPKELQIMKPYAPLGILYLCSHLRSKGFDVDAPRRRGFGLTSMRERAEMRGGTVEVRSQPGQGTEVEVIIRGG